jgi:hypothetical protein
MSRPACPLMMCIFSVALAACGSSSNPDPGNSCPAPTGAPISHSGWLAADEIWSADSQHLVTSDLTISKGVTVTLEPCTDVIIQKGFYFRAEGKLIARGEASRPIHIHGDGADRFAALWVSAPGSAELVQVNLDGGGALRDATIVVEGEGFPPSKPLLVDHVTITNAASYGIELRTWAGFADGSTDLLISGAGAEFPERPFPISMSLNAVGTIPVGQYTGNAGDAIRLVGESPHYNVEIDDVLHDRGVPYQVGGSGMFGIITVLGSAGPTLTIEPGVTIRHFTTDSNIGGFFVGNTGTTSTGRVVAVGTADRPITFTAAGKTGPGAWEGITFNGPVTSGNRLEHVRIENAGGHGGDSGFGCPPKSLGAVGTDGALKIFEQPPEEFLKSSTIASSSTFGVFRAWKGDEVDFLPSNTFEGVTWCNQVMPAPPTGSCPTDPPCPK